MTLAIPIGLCLAVQVNASVDESGFVSRQEAALWLFIAVLAGASILLWCAILTWQWLKDRKQNRLRDADHTRLTRAVHGIARKLYGAETQEVPGPLKTRAWTSEQMWRWRKESGEHER